MATLSTTMSKAELDQILKDAFGVKSDNPYSITPGS